MTIAYISTYLNHHNKPLCDALCELTDGFWYIATSRVSDWRRKMGFNGFSANYLLDYTDEKEEERIRNVVNNADVVIIGASEPFSLIRQRVSQGKLTIRCSERLFKTSYRYVKAPIHWYRSHQTKSCYMLCCSAKTARDYNLLGFYKQKCFKWGYFTEVKPISPEVLWRRKKNLRLKRRSVSILWVGRLIRLKHPEVAIKALKIIREEGFLFDFYLIGDGPVTSKVKALVDTLDLNDCVHLLGAKSTSEVREYMEDSELFLFTSNREEGWGAVLNESMSCACAVIANSEIGSVPFLIKNGENGLVYEKGSVEGLAECLKKLIVSEQYREELGMEAYRTISGSWSPENAAENLLKLIDALVAGEQTPIESGPCSHAE